MTSDQIEQALAALAPAPPELDRDVLMYQAGYQAARSLAESSSSSTFWKATTGLMTAATVALAVMLARQPAGDVPPMAKSERGREAKPVAEQVRVAAVPDVPPPPSSPRPEARAAAPEAAFARRDVMVLEDPPTNYFALREVVLRRGVDAWPVPRSEPAGRQDSKPPARAATVRELLEELLPQDQRESNPTNGQPTEASTRDEESIV